ncbi:endonuclease domain-containing protein [Sphingomonas sp. Root241]|uniref:endonuclease domain-containing protein n=1 Tax=Sphingomonas sp. Root241 TaxID=1736501 RepID=UPI0009E735BB|nr:endonuclease domain-containing protein [Sphingomonas sp. Root241]
MEDGPNDSALPLPRAGGDRGVGPRPPRATPRAESPKFRLERPTERARELRNDPTPAEKLLWSHLRKSQLGGFKFTRQLPVAGHFGDFGCRSARLIIELDGSQHAEQAERDAERTRRIEAEGYRVIRFWNNDLTTNMAGVLETILTTATACGERGPTPQPPPARGRGSRRAPKCP